MSNEYSTSGAAGTSHGSGPTAIQKAARLVGIVFLAVGLLGFIPGITSNYGDMSFASHGSGAMLLGLFQVSILHNIVHLLYGVAGLVLAKTVGGARKYFIVGGIVYLVLFFYGLVIDKDSAANFVPLNTADDFLHLFLGLGMLALGLVLNRRSAVSPGTATTH